MLRFLFIFLIFLFKINVYSQEKNCETDEKMNDLLFKSPDLKPFFQNYSSKINLFQKEYRYSNTVFTVPVVFHIVHNGGAENISKDQVIDGLRILNEDFSRLNADTINTRAIFLPIAANCQIEFKLAQIDPWGNCTDGITRNYSSLSINANDDVKDVVSWNNKEYLNVWIVHSVFSSSSGGTVAGYAYLPYPNQSAEHDGILIGHSYIGNIGTSTSSATGRTLTHEVGHYLGLRHTFYNGCDIDGDDCLDTPPVQNANYGCNYNANSCSSDNPNLPDQIENYMDYTEQVCKNMFTLNQKDIMHYSLTSQNLRAELVSTSNLNSTGVNINPPVICTPIAEFDSDRKIICVGEPVMFFDESYNGNPSIWTWNFQNGNPSTSNLEEPTITYNIPGIFDVSLTASNLAGSDFISKSNFIIVKPQTAITNGYYFENFESIQIPSVDWSVLENNYSDSWEITNNAHYSGSNSCYINNFNKAPGEIHELVSPPVDLTNMSYPQLYFKYSYTKRNIEDVDVLRIYASYNCGLSWSQRDFFEADELMTIVNNQNFSSFFPQSESEWEEAAISLASFASFDNLLVKFQFTSGGGNNIYLDDINISDLFSINEKMNDINIQITPNPIINNKSTLNIIATQQEIYNISIYTALGNIVYSLDKNISIGENEILFPSLRENGFYLVEIKNNNSFITKKVLFLRN